MHSLHEEALKLPLLCLPSKLVAVNIYILSRLQSRVSLFSQTCPLFLTLNKHPAGISTFCRNVQLQFYYYVLQFHHGLIPNCVCIFVLSKPFFIFSAILHPTLAIIKDLQQLLAKFLPFNYQPTLRECVKRCCERHQTVAGQ